ncbi:hypothetical protein [Kordiimonas sp.]|uniref:hypothetical protein n=1 Tax=Kordiimonas sp. TaxID=1970157 RepID=UPI003A919377
MITRSTENMVTFQHPFVVYGYKKSLPAGTYKVAFEEDLLPNLFFPAFRRTQATLHLHAEVAHPGVMEYLTISPKELEAALKRDEATTLKLLEAARPAKKTAKADRDAIERGEDEGMMWVSDTLPQDCGDLSPHHADGLRPRHNS